MRPLLLALLLLASQASAQTVTMTEPLSNGGWEGYRGAERVGPPYITLARCWHEMSADAEARQASAEYRCLYTWRRAIDYTAPKTVTLRLSWNAPERDEFGSPLLPGDVTGYRIHYGTEPGKYSAVVDVGDTLAHEMVLPRASYYIAVSAVAWGVESALSEEVAWSPP